MENLNGKSQAGGGTEIPAGLEKEVVEKISAEHIKPAAKWKFVFKNLALWFFGGISILLGALAFSFILHLFQPGEFRLLKHCGASWKELLLFSLPYFWILFLAVFLFFAWYYFKRTEKGYRYSLAVILATSILISVSLGSVLYGVGLSRVIDDFLGKKAPLYGELINPRAKFWLNPERGRLSGLVVEKNSNKEFIIYNKNLGKWQVETAAEAGVLIKKGWPVIVIGKKISPNHFQAEEIFWPPSGESFLRRGEIPLPPDRANDFLLHFHLLR